MVCMRQMHVSIVIANLVICRVLFRTGKFYRRGLIICTCRCRLFRRRHEIRVRYSTTLFDGEAAGSQAGGMREERLREKRRRRGVRRSEGLAKAAVEWTASAACRELVTSIGTRRDFDDTESPQLPTDSVWWWCLGL